MAFSLQGGSSAGLQGSSPPLQGSAPSLQMTYNPQQPVANFNLNQSGSGGIPIGGSNAANPAANPSGNANSGVYTGGSSGPSAAQQALIDGNIQAYQDNINGYNQLLGQADISQQHGQDSINNGYGNALAQLTGSNQTTLNHYGAQRTGTQQDYSKTINRIDANARNGYNSLEQLLGGTGSAGNILAPFAVSTQANQQRQGSSDAFAKNLQGIDEGVAAANQNFNNQKKTIEGQKNSQLQQLIDSINQQKIGYQQQIAQNQNQLNIARGGGYQTPTVQNANIAQLMQQMTDSAAKYAQPNFTVQDYVAPQLNMQAYQAQAARMATGSNQPTPVDTTGTDPTGALGSLLKQTDTTNTNAYSY